MKMQRDGVVFLCCIGASCVGHAAYGSTYSNTADQDTWVGFFSGGDFGNRNSDATIESQGGFGQNDRSERMLLKWDLSSIAPDSTINAATLTFRAGRVYSLGSQNGLVEVRSIVPGNAWTETSANWTFYDGNTNLWMGGTGGATDGPFAGTGNAVSNTVSASFTYPAGIGNGSLPAVMGGDVNLDLKTLVTSWITGAYENNGVSVQLGAGLSGTFAPDGYEFDTPSADSGGQTNLAPLLTIDFTSTNPVSQWKNNASGDWNLGGNWIGEIPGGVNKIASFGNIITSSKTVFTDTAVTVSGITFDNANTYVIAGSGSLTMQVNTGAASISVANGTHKINLPMTIASNTTASAAAGATLKISDPVTVAAGKVLSQSGAGAVLYESTVDVLTGGGLQMGSSSHMARLTLGDNSTATLTIGGGSAPAQKIDTVGLNATSVLDMQNNDLVTGTGQAAITNLVKNARNGGAWNLPGITSTTAKNNANHTTGLGVLSGAEYNTVGGTGSFSGRTYAATDTLVKYTWNGDANLDGRVTFDDYVKIDTGFNTARTGWLNGDFNYSGAVNFDDYVLIDIAFNQQNGTLGRAIDWISGDDRSTTGLDQAGLGEVLGHLDQFGSAYGSAFLAAVPEPATGAILGVLGMALSRRRRRNE